MERGKLRPLNAFMAFRCRCSQSLEKVNSANLITSILLVAASWIDAEDEVRPYPDPLGTGSVEALLGHRSESIL